MIRTISIPFCFRRCFPNTQNATAKGWICLPSDNVLKSVSVVKKGETWSVNAPNFVNPRIFTVKRYDNL
jgi:hypothetical protein